MTQPTIEPAPLCSHCGFTLPKHDGGLRHYGTHTAHQENECLRLLHAEINRLRAALTAQAGDGNRLPLEEIPAGYSFCEMRRSFNVEGGFNVRLISLTRDEYGIGKTPAEAMRAAIAAAKDGAG